MLCRGLKNVMLPILPSPKPGASYLDYPTNHYVIIQRVVRDENNDEYGEISEQSMLVFTSPQEKELAQGLPNRYLTLSCSGTVFFNRLF